MMVSMNIIYVIIYLRDIEVCVVSGETWEQAREGLESVFELQNLSQSLDTVKQ